MACSLFLLNYDTVKFSEGLCLIDFFPLCWPAWEKGWTSLLLLKVERGPCSFFLTKGLGIVSKPGHFHFCVLRHFLFIHFSKHTPFRKWIPVFRQMYQMLNGWMTIKRQYCYLVFVIVQYIGVKMKSPNTAKKKMSTLKCVRRPLSKTIPLLDLSISTSNMWPIT